MPEILVSVDVETTGPIPGPFSMISFGGVAYDPADKEISRFKINLHELPDAGWHPDTMKWWDTVPDAWECATKNPVEPKEAILRFVQWLNTLPGQPKLMGWPLPFDYMFLYWYCIYFVSKAPFGFDGIDIKSYAMAALRSPTLDEISKRALQRRLFLPDSELSHDPVDDAAQQAKLFFGLRKTIESRT